MVAIAICLAGSATMFAQETGVVINGVKWATRNVDKLGTFAVNPESAGMLYQWNSKIGWSATNPTASTNGSSWNPDSNHGRDAETWGKENNVCPVGWRMPTDDELKKLVDSGYEWTTVNGINGIRFGSGKNIIFLPSVGAISNAGSILMEFTFYWGNVANCTDSYYLYFKNNTDTEIFTGRYLGFPNASPAFCIRCVAE